MSGRCWNTMKHIENTQMVTLVEYLQSLALICNFEGAEHEWIYKGRVVFGGDNIKDGKGEWAIFYELGSVPTSMSACKVLLACSALNHHIEIPQSDCQRAYVQADLDGPPTFIELPQRMVAKALYGHPRADDLWADRLGSILNAQGFELVDNWPSINYNES